MGFDGDRFVVRVAMRSSDDVLVVRMRLRFHAGEPASIVLDALLRRVLAARRAGLSAHIERAPEQLDALLSLCGLEGLAVRR